VVFLDAPVFRVQPSIFILSPPVPTMGESRLPQAFPAESNGLHQKHSGTFILLFSLTLCMFEVFHNNNKKGRNSPPA
jgi:hypothetical protein